MAKDLEHVTLLLGQVAPGICGRSFGRSDSGPDT
jgi:hypothetical protein